MKQKEKLYYINENIYIDYEPVEVINEMWTLSQLRSEVDKLQKCGFTCDFFHDGVEVVLNVYLD